jgi:hypothetical protein
MPSSSSRRTGGGGGGGGTLRVSARSRFRVAARRAAATQAFCGPSSSRHSSPADPVVGSRGSQWTRRTSPADWRDLSSEELIKFLRGIEMERIKEVTRGGRDNGDGDKGRDNGGLSLDIEMSSISDHPGGSTPSRGSGLKVEEQYQKSHATLWLYIA